MLNNILTVYYIQILKEAVIRDQINVCLFVHTCSPRSHAMCHLKELQIIITNSLHRVFAQLYQPQ